MKPIEPPWSVPIVMDDIPETGQHVVLEAPEAVRNALAEACGLRTLLSLIARFDLGKQGRSVRVNGEVDARVGQTCVVTLEPIENEVIESVDLLFAPGSPSKTKDAGHGAPSADDGPERSINGVIDLGTVATEFLLLGIDPYPRKRGVKFTPPKSKETASPPFAALAALKKARE